MARLPELFKGREVRRRMEKLFEDLSSPGTFTAETEETDREFKVTFDLPGVKKDDVHVEVVGNQLRISGERKEEKEVKDRSFYHSERFYGLFERSFSLPKNVKIDEIAADFKDGVLKIAIPKSEIPKTHQVKIGDSKSTKAA